MGRYFGIANRTKRESVSSYWKGDEWCNCYEVMHQLHWDRNDKIHSSCYDSYYEFEYDQEKNTMICIDKLDEIIKECQNKNNDSEHDEDVWENDSDHDDDDDDDDNDNDIDKNEEDIEIAQGIKQPFKKYGFNEKLCANDKLNHIPIWENNKCTICEYMYNESLLSEYAKKFNPAYYMN